MKPEKKEIGQSIHREYQAGYNQCIEDQQAYENSIEGLPERKELETWDTTKGETCRNCPKQYNQMRDIAIVLLGKRDERIKDMCRQLSYLTPQGSEFVTFEECYNYIKEQIKEGHEAKKKVVYQGRELQASREKLSVWKVEEREKRIEELEDEILELKGLK